MHRGSVVPSVRFRCHGRVHARGPDQDLLTIAPTELQRPRTVHGTRGSSFYNLLYLEVEPPSKLRENFQTFFGGEGEILFNNF